MGISLKSNITAFLAGIVVYQNYKNRKDVTYSQSCVTIEIAESHSFVKLNNYSHT
jgi:hypothetical protein